MALNETHFQFAERGPVSVYKFRFDGDERFFVWFEDGDGKGTLHTTPTDGPYRVEDELVAADHADLDAVLAAHGTDKEQWVKDLMAQFGERLAWTYP